MTTPHLKVRDKSEDRIRRAVVALALIGSYVALHCFRLWTGLDIHFGLLLVIQLGFVVYTLGAAVVGHSHADRPVPGGRVVAIVPAFEETPEALNRCIQSILDQTGVVVTEIHVVDDGSTKHPVQPWSHPRVVWHWKPNGGKRSAQYLVLTLLAKRPETVDFILTVDSDSILQPDAVAQMLRAFDDPRVTGASGTVFVSNTTENLVARVADLNIGAAVTVSRMGMSLLGTLVTTSGALAMYRSHIPLKYRDDYLTSGTFGDDRKMTLYAELEGRVVMVPDAVVHSEMPTTMKSTFRQRLRWAKSKWTNLAFTLTNMSVRHLLFPLITVGRFMVMPILAIYLVYSLSHTPNSNIVVAIGFIVASWLNWRYAWTALYLMRRSDQSIWMRLMTWLFITPLEIIYSTVFILPIQYIALFKLRDLGWGTRNNPHGLNGSSNQVASQPIASPDLGSRQLVPAPRVSAEDVVQPVTAQIGAYTAKAPERSTIPTSRSSLHMQTHVQRSMPEYQHAAAVHTDEPNNPDNTGNHSI